MLVANAIAEVFKREGVKFIIGYPVNPIIEAAAEADIRTIIVRQERVGLHMADAVSRLSSGKDIGVFVMQHGPGAENAFGGVAQAYSESVPILVMPGGYARRIANYFPNFNSTLNMKHITKWAEPMTMGRSLPEVMRRAFWQLRNGRGGPVLVEVPADVFREEVDDDFTYVPSFKTRSVPDPMAIEEVAEVLSKAEKPVIYAGQGVHYAEAWPELKQLAEEWNIPVTTSLEGKSAFPENHPLSLGSGGRAIPKNVHDFLQDADLIFGIGCSFALTGFGVQMPRGKKPNPEEVRRWLGAYESGQRIDEIAAASHRARATVKKAIESAQRDAVSSRVREGLLRDAFQSHFADLLQGAIEIRDHTLKSRYRPAFPYPDRRRDLLLGGLREHIPDNGLWSALEQFNRVSRRLELILQE
ncbi:MAG: hypothetical protein IIA75_11005, partial [Proteobacteria bacterium]|nr:hypothetical protein [Pseudomonadota bacterium]